MTTNVAASIGIAMSGTFGETADDLLRNADIAMYAAKASVPWPRPGLPVRSFAPTPSRGASWPASCAASRPAASCVLDYQPIVELAGGAVVGLEALVRWQPPDRPLLMPDKFIDLAEQTGDIVPMGRWILREACRQVRAWQVRLGLPDLQVSVNLSARQFQEHDLVETVREVLEETELAPSSLVLEITESGLMQRTTGTIGRLTELRALGIHLAIDDFGTGYSSLSYLERFPVDSLKIDRSFIAELTPAGERPAIARAIVELGRTLGLHVVAEGIEQPDQAEWLISLGCVVRAGLPVLPTARRRGHRGIPRERRLATRPAPRRCHRGRRRLRRRTGDRSSPVVRPLAVSGSSPASRTARSRSGRSPEPASVVFRRVHWPGDASTWRRTRTTGSWAGTRRCSHRRWPSSRGSTTDSRRSTSAAVPGR